MSLEKKQKYNFIKKDGIHQVRLQGEYFSKLAFQNTKLLGLGSMKFIWKTWALGIQNRN